MGKTVPKKVTKLNFSFSFTLDAGSVPQFGSYPGSFRAFICFSLHIREQETLT